MIINAVADDNVTIREKIDQVRLELNQFKYKAYGISSAVVVVLGILALIIDLLKGL